MPELIDKETGQPVTLSGQEAQQAFMTRRAGFAPGTRIGVIDESGKMGNVAAEDLHTVLAAGKYRVADDAEVEQARKLEDAGTAGQAAIAGAEGVARGLTFGLSDAALTGLGADPEAMALRQEANPGLAIGGEAVGAIAPMLLSGGTSAAVSGASAAARGAGAAARTGQVIRGLGAIPRGTAALGRATETAAKGLLGSRAETLLGRGAALAAGGAAEGAVVGAGQAVSRAALDDAELTAEQLIAGAAEGAMFGAAAGGAIGAGAAAVERTAQKASEVAGSILSREKIAGYLRKEQGGASFRHAKGPGGGKKWVDAADELGGFEAVGQRGWDRGWIDATATREDIALRTKEARDRLADELSSAARRVAPDAVDAAEGLATFRAATGGGGKKWIKLADKFHGGAEAVGRRQQRLGIVKRGMSVEDIAERAKVVEGELGDQIGSVTRNLDAAGAAGVSNEELTKALRKKVLVPLTRSGGASQKALANKITRELESRGLMRGVDRATGELAPERAFTLGELHDARVALDRELGRFDTATKQALTEAYRDARRVVEDKLEAAIEAGAKQLDDATAASYKELKADFAAAKMARQSSEDAVQTITARKDPDFAAPVARAFDDADKLIETKFDDLVSGADDAAQLVEMKKDYQAARLLADTSADALTKEGTNRGIALSDMLAVVAGSGFGPGGVGSLVTALASGFVHNVIRERGAGWLAGGLAAVQGANAITRQAVQVERRMDSAVKSFFGKAKAGARRAAKRAVPAGAALGATRRERFERAVADTDRSPESVIEHATKRLGTNTYDPLATAYAGSMQRGLAFLQSKRPRPTLHPSDLRPDLDKTQRVPDSEMSKFLRYVDGVRDPMAVIDGIAEGDVTREGVEALQVVYPKMYDALVSRVTDMVAQADEPIAYNKLLTLSLVLDKPLHPSMEPTFVASVQRQFAPQPQEQSSDGGGSKAPLLSPSARKPIERSMAHQTQSQALEAS